MANTNKNPKVRGSAGGVLGVLGVVSTVVGIATPLVDIASEKIKESAEERKDWVNIPELCSKNMPMKLDAAIDALEKLGLKVSHSPLELVNAAIKYKDCFALQVICSAPKCKKLVPPGSMVVIRYVTSEIIEESQKLFNESENQKIKMASEKSEKRSKQKEKHKQAVEHLVSTVQQKAIDVSTKVKQTKVVHSKKKMSKEDEV